MANRVTIADVAQAAGVSMMTVSRVLNRKGELSLATAQRVQAVIERLGYRPSGIARGLATRHTGTIGLMVPDIANPFFSSLAQGVVREAYRQAYNVFLSSSDEAPPRELGILQSFEDKRVDGIILCSSRLGEAALEEALAGFSAAVVVNRRLKPGLAGTVVVDDARGGQLATQHLIRTGHQAIGFLAGPATSFSGRERALGYQAALRAANLPFKPEWVRHCAPTLDGGKQAARQLLVEHPELTALFAYNDLVAVGALHICHELRLRVPEDLAIVGADDIPLASLVVPQLTTYRVPLEEMGASALQLLLNRLNDCHADCADVVLEPALVVRASAPGLP